MHRKEQGFTLIELMIVVAIIAIIAAIAVPNLLSSRLAANEANAISTLRQVVSSQAQFQSMGSIDADRDGTGEYGWFAELSGAPVTGALDNRGDRNGPLDPPILGATFQTVADAVITKSGFHFMMILPSTSAANAAAAEDDDGGTNGEEDTNLSEVYWGCYAWPIDAGTTGNRAFFVNQRGEIVQTNMDNATYDGTGAAPAWSAAYDTEDITDAIGFGGDAEDGNIWTPVQ